MGRKCLRKRNNLDFGNLLRYVTFIDHVCLLLPVYKSNKGRDTGGNCIMDLIIV